MVPLELVLVLVCMVLVLELTEGHTNNNYRLPHPWILRIDVHIQDTLGVHTFHTNHNHHRIYLPSQEY